MFWTHFPITTKEQARARRETRLAVERACTAITMKANIESAKAEERIAINLQDDIEGRLHVVEYDAAQAVEAADEARQEAIEEANEAAAEAERAKEESEELKISTAKDIDLLSRQLKRAHRKAKALEERVVLAPGDRTLEEWAALSREARAKAVTRERTYLANFMASHEWRCDDLAFVLSQAGLLEGIFVEGDARSAHEGGRLGFEADGVRGPWHQLRPLPPLRLEAHPLQDLEHRERRRQ